MARLFPPESISLGLLSSETRIGKSTISTWKKKVTTSKEGIKVKTNLSPRDKFLIVMEVYSIREIELLRYYREKGLYLEDVKKWINSCMNSTNNTFESDDIKELRASKENDIKRV